MIVLRLLILFLLVALSVLPVTAQDITIATPVCTQAQVQTVIDIVMPSGIIDEAAAITERVSGSSMDDMIALFVDADALQRRWWSEIAPALPDCAFGQEVAQTVGRYLDEMTISFALLYTGNELQQDGQTGLVGVFSEAAAEHGRMIGTLSEELLAIANVFAALESSLTGAPTAPANTAPSATTTTYFVVSPGPANIRSAPSTDGQVITTVNPGGEVQVVTAVIGSTVNGSDQWYEVLHNGQTLYIHSSVVSQTRPAPPQPTQAQAAQPVPPVQQEQVQSQPPQPPPPTQQSAPPPQPAGGSPFQCNGADDLNCGNFSTHAQAQAHLQMCGDEDRLDGNDGDGLACESLP